MGPTAIVTFPLHPSPDYVVGRDVEGHWIVRDARELAGGIFVDRAAALRFAAHESDHRPNAVRVIPEAVPLTLTGALPAL